MNRTILILLTFLTANTFLFCFSAESESASGGQTFADSSKTDSLLTELRTANSKQKLTILNQLSEKYLSTSYEKSLKYARQQLVLARVLENKKEQAAALNNIGNVYENWSKYELALEYYQRALKINEKLRESSDFAESVSGKKGMAVCYNNIGLVHEKQGNYASALKYYHKSLKIDEVTGDKQGMATSLNNIGIVYYYQGNYEKAIEYYLQSLKICEKLGNEQGIAGNLNNIGGIYYIQENYVKTIEYYLRSLKIQQKLNNNPGIAISLNNIAGVYYNQGNYKKATEYSLQCLKIRKELGDKQGTALILNNIGNLFLIQNNYKKAIEYSKKSLTISKKIGSKDDIKNAYKSLAEIYFKMGNSSLHNPLKKAEYFKNAYEYQQIYSQMKDTLLNEESSRQIAEMQTKYETEKKEKQIILLNQEKQLKDLELNKKHEEIIKQRIFFVLGAVIIFITSLLLYIFFRNKEVKKRNLIEQELNKYMQKALSQQMNPHFIFNTLNSIQYFILKNDKIASNKYLIMFANLMRITLDNSQYHNIPIQDEINALNLYLELETLRFENKFDFKIIIDDNEILNYKIPTLLIQPYVENAIWHGLMHKKDGKGKIEISIRQTAQSGQTGISSVLLKIMVLDEKKRWK